MISDLADMSMTPKPTILDFGSADLLQKLQEILKAFFGEILFWEFSKCPKMKIRKDVLHFGNEQFKILKIRSFETLK